MGVEVRGLDVTNDFAALAEMGCTWGDFCQLYPIARTAQSVEALSVSDFSERSTPVPEKDVPIKQVLFTLAHLEVHRNPK